MGLRVISFTSRGGLGEFRNSSKQNQNYLERFWPSLPTGGVQDGKLKPSEKLPELLVKLGIENGGNYSPQLGPWTKSLLNSRQLQKLDVEYERLIVPQFFLKLHSWLVFGMCDVCFVLSVFSLWLSRIYKMIRID